MQQLERLPHFEIPFDGIDEYHKHILTPVDYRTDRNIEVEHRYLLLQDGTQIGSYRYTKSEAQYYLFVTPKAIVEPLIFVYDQSGLSRLGYRLEVYDKNIPNGNSLLGKQIANWLFSMTLAQGYIPPPFELRRKAA